MNNIANLLMAISFFKTSSYAKSIFTYYFCLKYNMSNAQLP